MCTVTWWSQPLKYDLFFNRDELKTRKPAYPPEVCKLNGVNYIAPKDGDFSGTWIFVNQYGLTLSLLNYYSADVNLPDVQFTSRGLLVLSLADCRNYKEVNNRLIKLNLSVYRPFYLVGLLPNNQGHFWCWDANRLNAESNADSLLPITTSSFQSKDVIKFRKKLYSETISCNESDRFEKLKIFHESHNSERGAYSVCMNRPDARTVSMSKISVSNNGIEFSYHSRETNEEKFSDEIMISLGILR